MSLLRRSLLIKMWGCWRNLLRTNRSTLLCLLTVLWRSLIRIMISLNFSIMLLLMISRFPLISFIRFVVSIRNCILGRTSLSRIIRNIRLILIQHWKVRKSFFKNCSLERFWRRIRGLLLSSLNWERCKSIKSWRNQRLLKLIMRKVQRRSERVQTHLILQLSKSRNQWKRERKISQNRQVSTMNFYWQKYRSYLDRLFSKVFHVLSVTRSYSVVGCI